MLAITPATYVTLIRVLLVPVFCWLAAHYAHSVALQQPEESLRWGAISVYLTCAIGDGIDGWMARKFSQKSALGALLDPIADKLLLLAGTITLCLYPWGLDDWFIPAWFVALVLARDAMILLGVAVLWGINRRVPIRPHWSGKVCTVTQMIAIGWTMLKPLPISPFYAAAVAAVFTIWSGIDYFMQGWRQLPSSIARGSARQK